MAFVVLNFFIIFSTNNETDIKYLTYIIAKVLHERQCTKHELLTLDTLLNGADLTLEQALIIFAPPCNHIIERWIFYNNIRIFSTSLVSLTK